MEYLCVFLGMIFTIGGITFAFGKIHTHLSAWKNMPNTEKEKIYIEALCLNVGGMIALNGVIFILKGFCAGFSEQLFTVTIIMWLVIAGFDVHYISKSTRYRNQ